MTKTRITLIAILILTIAYFEGVGIRAIFDLL